MCFSEAYCTAAAASTLGSYTMQSQEESLGDEEEGREHVHNVKKKANEVDKVDVLRGQTRQTLVHLLTTHS